MLRPFLLVGVGGSGGKTLRVIREDLLRRLEKTTWYTEHDDLPRAWQFLHIDVPTHPDGNDPDLPAQLPLAQYQGLVASGVTYPTIDKALAGDGRTTMGDAIAGWRPDPAKVKVPVQKGAGQYRTLGRMITVANLERVRAALEHAQRRLTGAEVMGELQAVTRILGGKALPSAPDPVVVVVSSLAGGSGAGAVIDVCDVIRSLGESWGSESMGILYAPDVFDYLPQEKRKGVRPNALATLAELLCGYWNTEGPSEATATLLTAHGLQLGAADRMGPRYPFLVGARNEHVSFATQNDIYRAMGRSIAAWVTSPVLQDRMVAYTQGNWSQTAGSVPDRLPLNANWAETPFSALGSARVGLGRDRFQDYAAQWMARKAVERTLRRHEELRGPGDERLVRTIITDAADTVFGSFLSAVQLNERGEKRNDIIDALRPSDDQELRDVIVRSVTATVCAEVPARGWSPTVIRQRIISELGAREGRFLDGHESGRRERARSWTTQVQDRLRRQVAMSIARNGVLVTTELLDRLETELASAREEMKVEATRFRRWAEDIQQQVAKELESGGAELLLGVNPQVASAVKRGIQTLEWKAEAQLRDLVAELIPDLVEGVVKPLATAVWQSSEVLAQQ